MALSREANARRPIRDRVGDWCRKWRERRSVLDALDRCGPVEFDRMAWDSGVSSAELRVLAGKWPDSASLLARRVVALGVDAAALGRGQPQVLRDLQRVCSVCVNKRACEHDLDRAPDRTAWRDYCANADTFGAVVLERSRMPAQG